MVGVSAAAPSEFLKPVRLPAGEDGFVKVENPGYASPCVADIDGDGVDELLVGQFNTGKIRVYERIETEGEEVRYDGGRWLEAGGKVAEVPGVW